MRRGQTGFRQYVSHSWLTRGTAVRQECLTYTVGRDAVPSWLVPVRRPAFRRSEMRGGQTRFSDPVFSGQSKSPMSMVYGLWSIARVPMA